MNRDEDARDVVRPPETVLRVVFLFLSPPHRDRSGRGTARDEGTHRSVGRSVGRSVVTGGWWCGAVFYPARVATRGDANDEVSERRGRR